MGLSWGQESTAPQFFRVILCEIAIFNSMQTEPPYGFKHGIRVRLGHFLCGFILGFTPIFLLSLYRGNVIEDVILGSVCNGLIFGGLAAAYGRPMLKFLVRFFGDGCG
jgi:hypothetical protein